MEIKPIAFIRSDFPDKFGIPRQGGIVNELESVVIFEPEYRNDDALRGLEGYSHIWLLWQFSAALRQNWSPTVRPPRLGGNKRMGVFATRSPFRPNPIGLSCVELKEIRKNTPDGTVLVVGGADLMDKTPIYDIKPYLPFCDCHENAVGGFSDEFADYRLSVECSEELLSLFEPKKRQALINVLACDPRPSYQNDENRVYGILFSGFNITFTVKKNVLTVKDIQSLEN